MAKVKLTLSDVAKKHLKMVGYLIVSGTLAVILARITNSPELMIIFGGAINYALWIIEKEIKGEGVREALKNTKG